MAAQIGDILDNTDVRYVTIDLDWLTWYQDHRRRPEGDRTMLFRNLASVVANYRSIDIEHFVLALALEARAEVSTITETIGMPLRTVEMTVPIDLIEQRLAADPTTGRRLDLETARTWKSEGAGAGFSDLTVDNTRPITEVAYEVLEWLGWWR